VIRKGFTLLEMLIAVSIFAIIGAMAFNGLNQLLKNEEILHVRMVSLQILHKTFITMQRDLSQASARPVRDPLGAEQDAFIASQRNTYWLEFTRSGRNNPLGWRRSAMMRVAYAIEDDQWVRYFWPVLDSAPGMQPERDVLLSGIRVQTIRFLGEEHEWFQTWPPPSVEKNKGMTMLPKAVEWIMDVPYFGSVRRIVVLSS